MSHACILVALPPTPLDKIEEAVAHEMAPFSEEDEWFKDGSRWDWWVIGGRYKTSFPDTVMQAADFPLTVVEDDYDDHFKKIGEKTVPASSYAFLRERVWNEGERMGWFGSRIPTEGDGAQEQTFDCDEGQKATIRVWNESWEAWSEKFRARFIETLPAGWILVVVDYHV